MVSALMMLRRVVKALHYAAREEAFLPVLSAGVLLVVVGTMSYALGEGWHVVDAFYFAVSTLTATSVADPELVLEHRWLTVFTVFYILIGIGVLVELIRRLGAAFVAVRSAEAGAESATAGQP
jgi:Ion channel